MKRIRCEVLIVGGGPAGSTTAYKLAKAGVNALVIDFKKTIGSPVQCAEFVPIQLFHQFGQFFDDGIIAQAVKRMAHFTPWGEMVYMDSPGFVLNRELFDYKIHLLALESGARFTLRTRFLGLEEGKALIEHIDTRERMLVEFDLLVGADVPVQRLPHLPEIPQGTF